MTLSCKWWLALTVLVWLGALQAAGQSQEPNTLSTRSLQIDFTLPLNALVEGAAQATGISFDEINGHFIVLHNRNQLSVVSSEGEPIRHEAITAEESLSFQGITVDTEEQIYVVAGSGEVHQLDADPSGIGMFEPVDTAILEVASIAYDPDLTSLYAIGLHGKKYLYQLLLDGGTANTELDERLDDFQIVGTDFHDSHLYALAQPDPNQPQFVIIELTRQGTIVRAWSFEAPAPLAPAGIAVLDPDRGEFAIAHNNDEATVTLLEDPTATEDPVAEGIPLDLVRLFELGHRQPSGVTYDAALSALYYVTDFGEVLRSDLACPSTVKLFGLEGISQGDIEAIDVGADDTLVVLKSDLPGEPPRLQSYGLDGQLIGELTVAIDAPDHVFSSMAYDRTNQVYYLVTGTDDGPAGDHVLYRVDLQGRVQTSPLPPELAAYTTVGLDIDVSGTRLWLVTAEKYVVLLELGEMEVLGIRTINETPAPSGIAVSETMIYITSDTDQSLVYGYRLPN